uniref:Uncharacterized protein n=1 Tax=Seriola dumerili TaxID=41447 RepID=A0A3B4UTK5_SERDU
METLYIRKNGSFSKVVFCLVFAGHNNFSVYLKHAVSVLLRYRHRSQISIPVPHSGPYSQVDETAVWGQKRAPPDSPRNTKKVRSIQIITGDLIRSIKIPKGSFRLQIKSSHQLSLRESSSASQAEFKAAEERKRQLYEIDLSRKENPALRVNAEMEQEEEIKNLKQADPECFAVPINPRSSDPGEEKDPGKVVKAERRLDAMMEVDRRSRPWRPRVRLRELAEKSRGVKAMQQLHHQIQGRSGGRSKLQDRDKRVRETQTYLEALEKKKEQAAASCTWRYMRNHAENIQAKEQRREEEEAAGGLNMRAEAERVKRGEESVISRLRTPAGESQRLTWQSKNERARSQNPRNQRTENGGENRKRQLRMEQVHCKERFLSMEGAESARAGTSQTEGDGGEAREKALRHAETITDKQIREHELSAIAKRREIFQQDT